MNISRVGPLIPTYQAPPAASFEKAEPQTAGPGETFVPTQSASPAPFTQAPVTLPVAEAKAPAAGTKTAPASAPRVLLDLGGSVASTDWVDPDPALQKLPRPTVSPDAFQASRIQLEKFEDGYTQQHMQRSGQFASALGDALDGTSSALTAQQKKAVTLAARVYDVGKLAVPEELWLLPGKPDAEQWNAMKTHVDIGLTARGGNSQVEEALESFPEADFPSVRGIIRHHHERWDGNGYPDKLAGDAIPLGAQLIGIGDMFDSLVCERPFRPAKSYEAARNILEDSASKGQFNPALVNTFFQQVVPSAERLKDMQAITTR